MKFEEVFSTIKEFSSRPKEESGYEKTNIFVMGEPGSFAPFKYLSKKHPDLKTFKDIQNLGFIADQYDFIERPDFKKWYEDYFQIPLDLKLARSVVVFSRPDLTSIARSLEEIHKNYTNLRNEYILINNKNLPVQLGEWFAKAIFGLKQVKSSSQRGFDFELEGKRVEVKVHWNDKSSPKGVKLRKSLLELSDLCILIFVAKNFTIRDICVLDSPFVLKKFGGKGHVIFLKDSELEPYFFSRSTKQFEKIVDPQTLLAFASPTLAMKVAGKI